MKVAFLDIDGTLVQGSSWEMITEGVGGSIYDLYSSLSRLQSGEVSLDESISEVLENWGEQDKADRETISQVFETMPLVDDTEDFIHRLEKNGFQPVLITGSMDLFASIIARRLGVATYFYNSELIFDNSGSLNDLTYIPDQAALKLQQAATYCNSNDIDPASCIAVGDSDNDLELFKFVGKSYAIRGSSTKAESSSTIAINNLAEIQL